VTAPLAFIGSLGLPELLVLLFIIVILVGWRRLPELGKGLGEGIRNFRSAMRGDEAGPPRPPEAGEDRNHSG